MAALTLTMTSCLRKASDVYGEQKTITAPVQPFSSIELNAAGLIRFTQDSVTKVRLTGPENIVKNIAVEYTDSTLRIYQLDNTESHRWIRLFSNTSDLLVINVAAPALDGITITGSGGFEAKKVVSDRVFGIFIGGSGNVDIEHLKAAKLTTSITGSGNVDIESVHTDALETSISGSGNIDIDATGAKTATFTISGSGNTDASLHSAGDVSVSINGMGNIDISGDARSLTTDCEGLGRIDTDDLTIIKK